MIFFLLLPYLLLSNNHLSCLMSQQFHHLFHQDRQLFKFILRRKRPMIHVLRHFLHHCILFDLSISHIIVYLHIQQQITNPVKLHMWDIQRIVCTQSLPLPRESREVISDRPSSQKRYKGKEVKMLGKVKSREQQ